MTRDAAYRLIVQQAATPGKNKGENFVFYPKITSPTPFLRMGTPISKHQAHTLLRRVSNNQLLHLGQLRLSLLSIPVTVTGRRRRAYADAELSFGAALLRARNFLNCMSILLALPLGAGAT